MDTFKGLVYVKHGRVGTRSEGPDYYLQTARRGELRLEYHPRHPWEADYQLEFYGRRMVEVTGELDASTKGLLHVERIVEILSALIPHEHPPEIQYDMQREVLVLSADVSGGFVPPNVTINHITYTKIYGDGKVVFVDPAKGSVSSEICEGRLSSAEIIELLRTLQKNGFWGLKPYYKGDNVPTDMPSYSVTAKLKGQPEKEVGAYAGGNSAPPAFMDCYHHLVVPALKPSDVRVYVREEITAKDLEQGWYYGYEYQKKLNTPRDWRWVDAGRSSAWRAPKNPA